MSSTQGSSPAFSKASAQSQGRLMMQIIVERKKFIILCGLVAALFAAYWFADVAREYKSVAKISLPSSQTYQGSFQSNASVAEVILSRDVVENVIVKYDLYRLPEFSGIEAATDYYTLPNPVKNRVYNNVSGNADINIDNDSNIISIVFHSRNPVLAADVANGFVATYSEFYKQKNADEAELPLRLMTEKIDRLADDVRQAHLQFGIQGEAEAEDIDETPPNLAAEEQREEIEAAARRLAATRASLVETEVVLEEINDILYAEAGPLQVPTFIDVPLFTNLKQEATALERKVIEAENEFGADSEEVKSIKQELSAFQEKLEREIILYANSLQVKKDIEQAEVQNLEDSLISLKAAYSVSQMGPEDIANAEMHLNFSKDLLNRYAQDYLISLHHISEKYAPVTILSKATPSQYPDRAGFCLILLAAIGIGAGLGAVWSILSAITSRAVQNAAQIERITGFPIYSTLPFVKILKGDKAIDYLNQHPSSALAENLRGLLATIQLKNQSLNNEGKVITVTSTHTDEGKTTFSVWLATTAAQSGKKVLIIDADMRRPSLHKAYEIGNARGLADYLSGRLPLEDTLYKNHASGVHLMTSKAIPVHALMLLSGDRMEALIRRLRNFYDLIIIDAPTSLVFTDAKITANLSDNIFYVVEPKKTFIQDLKNAVNSFTKVGFNNIAFIFNKQKDFNGGAYNKQEMAYLRYFEEKNKKQN